MPRSILDAIKQGDWSFEPPPAQPATNAEGTKALPGTDEKLGILAERLRLGLPLWHPSDRLSFDDRDAD